ncbi:MAG: methionyl-tRNA synthetase [Alteromonas naphthalenivorans]
MNNKFYVTTPIYYATATPHLGTLYSTVLADIAARWNKIQGKDVFFLTGTDEFGQKVAQAAEKVNQDPKAFVSQFIPAYKELWKKYEIDYSHFIRTTDEYHIQAVQKWLGDLEAKGDIYKGAYEGWYCTPCETYLTEKDFEAGTKNPACVSCERATQWVSEPCYFFKLSAYQDKLLKFFEENPNFITPKERFAEVISFVKGGLQDLSISRTTLSWGVPFPNDKDHVTYVWADALNNYLTGIGYNQDGKQEEFKKWWPADLQVLGKDIVRFHAIFWPAFLMASDLPLPKKLLVHGWIKMGDHKMSKSRGNSVDPQDLYKIYGPDSVRYYLARQLSIAQDGQFTVADLEQKITSDLANDLGNLLQRMVSLATKNKVTEVTPSTWGDDEQGLQEHAQDMIESFKKEMERGYYHMALSHLWKFINAVNAYFHASEPWKLAKTEPERFMTVLSATCHSLHMIATMLWPVMPEKMEELFKRLGYTFKVNDDKVLGLVNDEWNKSFTLTMGDPLFSKPEPRKEEQEPAIEKESYIDIEDFIKVDLRVGTIKECEVVEKSERLLKSQVDLGPELGVRQIFSGIKKWYTPEELIGKQVIVVANLKPRKMMGELSQGMISLADGEDGKPTLISPVMQLPNGAKLK